LSIGTKRILAIAGGVALVALIGLRIHDVSQEPGAGKGGAKKKAGGRVVNVEVVESRIGEVREKLQLTGSLKPKEQVDITPKSTGRVEKLYFQIGDRVSRGEPVAELEDDELQQQVNRAKAALTVAEATLAQRQAELENARAEMARAESLFAEDLLSSQEYHAQRTSYSVLDSQVELAKAQKEQAAAELRELEIRLAQTKIYSPLTGIAATRFVDEGALVSPTTPILSVVNLSTMVTRGNVPERNIGRLRVGNEAQIQVDAMPDRTFRGRVARIAPVLDAATRTALIEIDIPNPNLDLKAEMFARIHLDLGTTRETLLIPRKALVYRGRQPGVYLVDGQQPVFQPIETGMSQESQVEVLANLQPGAKIVGRGSTMLRPGDRISAVNKLENPAPGRPGPVTRAEKRDKNLPGGAGQPSGTAQ